MPGAEPAIYGRLAQCHYQLGLKNSLPGEKQAEKEKKEDEKAEEVFQIMIQKFDKDYRAYLVRAEYRSLNMKTFKLTDQAFEALKSNTVPEAVREKLNPLKNRGLLRDDLAEEITNILKDETKQFHDIILTCPIPQLRLLRISGEPKNSRAPPMLFWRWQQQRQNVANRMRRKTELVSGLAAHPNEPRLCLTLAQLEFADGKRKEAIARLRSGVEALPNQVELVVELIHRLIDTGAFDDAKQTLKEAMVRRLKLTDHAFAALRHEHMPEPVLSKLNVLKDKELSKEDLRRKIGTVLDPDENEQWEKPILRHAAKANSKLRWVPNDTDLLTARLAIAAGKWSKAVPILEALRRRVPTKSPQAAQINLLLSRNAARLGDLDKQIELLKQSLDIAPNAATQNEYAMALVEAGKAELALGEFRLLH